MLKFFKMMQNRAIWLLFARNHVKFRSKNLIEIIPFFLSSDTKIRQTFNFSQPVQDIHTPMTKGKSNLHLFRYVNRTIIVIINGTLFLNLL